jgi:hypothetical protein
VLCITSDSKMLLVMSSNSQIIQGLKVTRRFNRSVHVALTMIDQVNNKSHSVHCSHHFVFVRPSYMSCS